MDIAKFNSNVADVKHVNGAKRSEIVAASILCSEGGFAAAQLADGKVAAIWCSPAEERDANGDVVAIVGGHVNVYADRAALEEALNGYEKQLLAFGVVKD